MRTTVNLDDDVASAVEQRRVRGKGLSEVVNELIRAGLAAPGPSRSFRQRSRPVGLRVDVHSVADALEQLDGPGAP